MVCGPLAVESSPVTLVILHVHARENTKRMSREKEKRKATHAGGGSDAASRPEAADGGVHGGV